MHRSRVMVRVRSRVRVRVRGMNRSRVRGWASGEPSPSVRSIPKKGRRGCEKRYHNPIGLLLKRTPTG
jgi:hypothetical protein